MYKVINFKLVQIRQVNMKIKTNILFETTEKTNLNKNKSSKSLQI